MSAGQCAEEFSSQHPTDTHVVSGVGGTAWDTSGAAADAAIGRRGVREDAQVAFGVGVRGVI